MSLTQTLGSAFGGGLVMGDTGVLLNNMCLWFEIDPDASGPNRIAPGKRVDFCVSPMQVFQDGTFTLSIGTPGSYGILQTTMQMLVHMLDFGMTIQEALELPRFRYFEDRRVEMEDRFPRPCAKRSRRSAIRSIPLAIGLSASVVVRHLSRASGVYQGGRSAATVTPPILGDSRWCTLNLLRVSHGKSEKP